MSRNTSSSAPSRVVARRELHGVTGVHEVDEAHAFHDPPGVDVETGDHPDGAHAAIASSTVMAPSTSAVPDDGTGQSPTRPSGAAAASSPASADRSVGRPHPSRRHHGMRAALEHGSQPDEVGAAEHAVAVDGGHHHRPQVHRRQAARGRRRAWSRSAAPTRARPARPGAAVVEAHRHPARVARRQRLDELGGLEGGGAEHHTLDAVVEEGRGIGGAAHAPARLHRDVDGGRRSRARRHG